MLQIEPGVAGLVGLVFPLLLSEASGKPVLYKPREPVLFDHANPVEIKVTAVLLCRFRMENIRALESQLLRNQVTKFCLDQSALLAAKIFIELRDDLLVGKIYEGEKIINHAYGVADTQAVFRSQCDDGLVLSNPIGSAKHFAILCDGLRLNFRVDDEDDSPRITLTLPTSPLERSLCGRRFRVLGVVNCVSSSVYPGADGSL